MSSGNKIRIQTKRMFFKIFIEWILKRKELENFAIKNNDELLSLVESHVEKLEKTLFLTH